MREGLAALHEDGTTLLIMTKGRKERVERSAAALQLAQFFDEVIEAVKTPGSFDALMQRAPQRRLAFVVGDQLESNVPPAKQAGFVTIYFPGGFRPKWEPDAPGVLPDHHITGLFEAGAIVRAEVVRLQQA